MDQTNPCLITGAWQNYKKNLKQIFLSKIQQLEDAQTVIYPIYLKNLFLHNQFDSKYASKPVTL